MRLNHIVGLSICLSVGLMAKNPFFMEKKEEVIIPVTPVTIVEPIKEDTLPKIKLQLGQQGDIALPPLAPNSTLKIKEPLVDIDKIFITGIIVKNGILSAIVENKAKQVGIYEQGKRMIIGDTVFIVKDISLSGIEIKNEENNKVFFIPYGGKPSEGQI